MLQIEEPQESWNSCSHSRDIVPCPYPDSCGEAKDASDRREGEREPPERIADSYPSQGPIIPGP